LIFFSGGVVVGFGGAGRGGFGGSGRRGSKGTGVRERDVVGLGRSGWVEKVPQHEMFGGWALEK